MHMAAATAVVTLPDGTTQSFVLNEKTFKTGSRGFHDQGKITAADGQTRYQVNLLLTEIGSKPKA